MGLRVSRGEGQGRNVSDEVSPQTLKEGLNGVIFMGSFIVFGIGVGIWWLRRNA